MESEHENPLTKLGRMMLDDIENGTATVAYLKSLAAEHAKDLIKRGQEFDEETKVLKAEREALRAEAKQPADADGQSYGR